MTMVRFQLDDIEVQRILNYLGSYAFTDKLLRDIALKLRTAMQGRTPVGAVETRTVQRGGQILRRRMANLGASGHAKSAWTEPLTTGANEVSFSNPLIYSTPLEFGSEPGSRPWPRPGPRTMLSDNAEGSARVYSRQAPGGMFDPAVEQDLHLEEMINAIIEHYNTIG
jgi:hypothetical protein